MLGPLLFIIYNNDLGSWINIDISKFTDDTKIGRQSHSDQDGSVLQDELDQLGREVADGVQCWEV